ncbi:MAG TPA: hypothetical protein VJ654_03065 [Noviherbaspirillum sp.]|nr:hypothetical protein [Noviherbaspirillum sp.]
MAEAVISWLVSVGFSQAAAAFVFSFAASTALSFVVSQFARPSAGGYSSAMQDRTHVVRSSIQPRNIIYGEVVTSGPLVFAASTDKGTDKNKYLHLVIALAGHEVNAITDIWLNDDKLTLDADGSPTEGKYFKDGKPVRTENFTVAAGATTITLSDIPTKVISVTTSVVDPSQDYFAHIDQAVDYTQSGIVLTIAAPTVSTVYTVNYETSDSNALVRVKKHLGGPGQTVDTYLQAAVGTDTWDDNHILAGCAYLYVRLEYDQTVFVTGIPNIKARVQGKKVLDPRTSTTAYSNNYALCVYDYMLSPDGLGCTTDDIDTASVIASANTSDELVTITGGTQKRYAVNGVVLLDHTPEENLRQLSTAGGGPAPVLAGGTFYVHVGAYDTPAITLTESDLRGPIKVRPRQQRRNLFNAVKGTYVDDDNGTFQPIDFPMVRNALYKTQDGAVEIVRDMQLPFTTNGVMAQRLAKIALERSRQGITVEFPCKVSGFSLQAWDTVQLTLTKFGWTNKVFRVMSWSFNTDSGIDLELQEEASGVYAWNMGEETTIDLAPDTNLPDPSIVAPVTALTADSGSSALARLADGTIISRVHLSWTLSPQNIAYSGGKIEVQYQTAGSSAWLEAAPLSGSATECYLFPVRDRQAYNMRVRMQSNRGALSDWAYLTHTVAGKSEIPPNVTGFTLTSAADGTRIFTFTITDQPLDVVYGGGFRIRYRTAGSGVVWSSMTPLHAGLLTQSPYETKNPAAGTYDFAIVAVDSSGFESAAPAFLSSATVALDEITKISSDNWLSKGEKSNIVLDYSAILAEKAGIDTEADTYGQSRTAYDNAVTALTTYLTGLSPAYNDFTQDTAIVGATFRGKFADVYAAKQALINAILSSAKTRSDNASSAAATAQSAADAANLELANIASDSVLSKGEKPAVVADYNAILAEQTGIDTQANLFVIVSQKTAYDNAISALTTYLTGLSPTYTDYTNDTTIVGTTFRSKFADVYSTRQALLNAISSKAKTLADNAQSTANSAQSAANDAATAASNAQVSADAANAELTNIANDNVLSKGEKPVAVADYNAIIAEQSGIDSKATYFTITTEKTAYDNAVTALTAYITGLSPAYNDFTQNTNITGTTFRQKFADVYSARQALVNAIYSKASSGTYIINDAIQSLMIAANQVTKSASATATTQQQISTGGTWNELNTLGMSVSGLQSVFAWASFIVAGAHIGSSSSYDLYFDGNYWKFNTAVGSVDFNFMAFGALSGLVSVDVSQAVAIPIGDSVHITVQALITGLTAQTYAFHLRGRVTTSEGIGVRQINMAVLETKR